MRHHPLDQRLCEFAHPRLCGAKFPELIDLVRPFAALEITPEMILNRSFSSAPSFTHYPLGGLETAAPCWLRTSDKTFAISTAARAASVPRLIVFSRQRARAWFSLSKLSTALITGTPCSIAMRCRASVTERLRFCAWLVSPCRITPHAMMTSA